MAREIRIVDGGRLAYHALYPYPFPSPNPGHDPGHGPVGGGSVMSVVHVTSVIRIRYILACYIALALDRV